MQDEIKEIKIEEKNTYTSRKGKTYEFTNTSPSDWKEARIKGYLKGRKGKDLPVYDKKGYSRIETPYSNDVAHFSIGGKIGGVGCCNLCGHGILDEYIIINDKIQKYMIVGSECVHNKYGVVVREKIKVFKDNEIRKEFIRLRVSKNRYY